MQTIIRLMEPHCQCGPMTGLAKAMGSRCQQQGSKQSEAGFMKPHLQGTLPYISTALRAAPTLSCTYTWY